jgi:MFS family permease
MSGFSTSRPGNFLRTQATAITLLLAGCALYFFSFFQRVAVPGTIFDELQIGFQATAGQVAMLGAIYLYIYSLMQLVAGVLNDRFGPGRMLVVGGVLLSLGALLFPAAPSLPLLYSARVLVAFGASLLYLSLVKSVDVLFDAHHFAPLIGVCIFLGYAGGLAGTFPFERAVHAFGWRQAMAVAGVLTVAATLATALLYHRAGRLHAGRGVFRLRDILTVLGNRASLPNIVAAPLSFSVYFVVQATIGKKLLADYCGLESSQAAAFTFAMMLVTMCAATAGGLVTRLLGNRRKPAIVFSIAACMLASAMLLAALHGNWPAPWFLAAYLVLAATHLSAPAGAALIRELNPPGLTGTAVGVLNAAVYLGVAVFTTLAGLIMDRYESQAIHTPTAILYPRQAYETIFAVCLAMTAIALFIAIRYIRESHGRSLWRDPVPSGS